MGATAAMVVSAPGSPESLKQARPHSYFGAPSPEQTQKSRPQSMMYRPPPRSQSRMSQSSYSGKQGQSRTSEDDGKTAVKVGTSSEPHRPIYELLTSYSRPSATASEFLRPRVRPDPATISALDSPSHCTYITRRRVSPRAQALHLRPSLWRRLNAERHLGVPAG